MVASQIRGLHSGQVAVASFALLFAPVLIAADGPQATPPPPGQVAHPSQNPRQNPPDTNLPNTVSAPPFTVRQKFDYRIVQSLGFRGLGGGLVGAAIGQARDAPHEWGQGAEGLAKRYASGLAGNLSRQTFAFVIESALHEDPRYFPSEDKRKKQRAWNAIKQAFMCKRDNGGSSFAYGKVLSQFAGGQFTNVWQPASTGSVTDGLVRAVVGLGGDTAYNLMQEFLPFTRPHSLRRGP